MNEEARTNEAPRSGEAPGMRDDQYALVGWLAIASAILLLPTMFLGIILHPKLPAVWPLLILYVPLAVVQAAFSIYALYRFRGLLNDRYRFHDVDNLVLVLIMGTIAIGVVGLLAKIGATLGLMPVFAAVAALGFILMIGIPMAVVGIVFAVRLLRLGDDLWGLLRPFAYTTIAACLCYVTIVLAPIGGLVDAASTVLLGIIFLRAARGLPQVEFV